MHRKKNRIVTPDAKAGIIQHDERPACGVDVKFDHGENIGRLCPDCRRESAKEWAEGVAEKVARGEPKRRDDLSETEREDLALALGHLPELATLRRFADRIHRLFDTPKDARQARRRRAAVVRDPASRAVPELVEAMEQLDEEEFPEPMAYLKSPVSRRVRTDTHMERTNRMYRFLEKWRRRRTLVRFVILTLDAIWKQWTPPKAKKASRGRTQVHEGRRSRRAE